MKLSPGVAVLPLLCALMPGSLAAVQHDPVSGDPTIVVPGSSIETLFEDGFFTEGPAMAPDGSLFFSDITITARSGMQAGHIWRLDRTTGVAAVYRSPSGMSNGLIIDASGRLLAAEGADFGGRRITATDLTTGKATILAGRYQGARFNSPNDMVIDAGGRIYFTDPRYFGDEALEQPVEGVYRIDTDGGVALVTGEITKPNGILLSPDQSRLFVASIGGGAGNNGLSVIELEADGSARSVRRLLDFGTELGIDGMAMDTDGNIYATRPVQPAGVYVYAPDGSQLALIPTPAQPRNVQFGRGDASHTLFIAAGRGIYSIDVRRTGYHPG